MKLRKLLAASGVGVALAFGVISGGIATAAPKVHDDYPHPDGTLYGCSLCEELMDAELDDGLG